MSIFGNIMSSIFGHAKAQTAPACCPIRLLASAPAQVHDFRRTPAGSYRRRVRRPLPRAAPNPRLHQARRSLRSMSRPYSPSSPAKTRRSSIGESRSSI